jgi:anti-sigma factor RsiW
MPMTGPGADMKPHPEIEAQFSDYHEGTLDEAQRQEIEAHLAACEPCRAAYAELEGMVSALSGLHRMSAPQRFDREVQETIRRRSAGRFFGRKAFGDRVPFELLAILVLALGLAIFFLIRSSRTGSLRYDATPEQPYIAPGARDVVPQIAPEQGGSSRGSGKVTP